MDSWGVSRGSYMLRHLVKNHRSWEDWLDSDGYKTWVRALRSREEVLEKLML